MSDPAEYREVFGSPSGRHVLADLAAIAERYNSEPGSACRLVAHITRILHAPDRDQPARGLVSPVPRGGGRIEHG